MLNSRICAVPQAPTWVDDCVQAGFQTIWDTKRTTGPFEACQQIAQE